MIQQAIADGLVSAATYLLVALGFALLYSTARFFNFAHGVVLVLAPYVMLGMLHAFEVPLCVAAIVGIAASLAAGCLFDLGAYRPLRRRGASSLVMLLASLGIYVVVQNVVSMTCGDSTKMVLAGAADIGQPIFGVYLTLTRCATLAVALISAAALWATLKWTRWGCALRAVASDPELANASGINSEKAIILSIAVGSALAGSAGVLVALDVGMTPDMGLSPLMMAVVVMIVGGSRSVLGLTLAAIFIGVSQHLAILQMPAQWKDCVAFLLLLFFLLFRPQGVLGKRARAAMA